MYAGVFFRYKVAIYAPSSVYKNESKTSESTTDAKHRRKTETAAIVGIR